jgi:hypothetical protein
MATTFNGSCLCGSVQFIAVGDLKRVSACYCGQCRKQNGGGPFFGAELQGTLTIEQPASVRWYDSSSKAKRAFCSECGSSLFWQSNADRSFFDVSLGALDGDHGLSLDAHIFVDSCPSYLSVPDTAPHMTAADVLANPLGDSGLSPQDPTS